MKRSCITLLIFCMLGVISCDDFLKETPYGKITTDNALLNASDLERAVHGLYRLTGLAMNDLTPFIQALMGDDLSTHYFNSKAMIREWDIMWVSAGNDRLLWCWESKYRVIKSANFIISGAKKTPGATQADIDYALGQAHFWRAWAYFYLVRTFGTLPKP